MSWPWVFALAGVATLVPPEGGTPRHPGPPIPARAGASSRRAFVDEAARALPAYFGSRDAVTGA